MYDIGEVDVDVVLLAAFVVVRHALGDGDSGSGGRGWALTMVMGHDGMVGQVHAEVLWFVRITAWYEKANDVVRKYSFIVLNIKSLKVILY